ncbi:DUF4476 domain-containing protein [Hymenobacter negativus]|uniref:DUF4476 domain-containing protein n=1 Tax=Hymenobacter negativus TaxID=2795026 RepID=UPI001AAF8038|nr:DUF4476 domain-containing protein [Hymenobacter negativus]
MAYPPAPANVNFSSERGVPFGLVLDGRPLTRGMARQVHVDQLVPGLHWADFSVPTAYGGAVRFRSRVWLEPGLETTFVLVTRPGRPLYLQQVNAVSLYGGGRGYGNGYNNGYGGRYNSPTPYPAPVPPAPGYGNDPYNGGNPNSGYDDGSYSNGGNGGYNTPNPNNNGGDNNAPNNGNSPYGTNSNAPGGYHNGSNNGTGYYPGSTVSSYRALAPQDVNGLVQTMRQRITEVSKLNAAKDGLKDRSIQADDLDRLLRSLNSEACRIELAEFAYSHVSDPNNFSRVYDAFETEDGARAVEQAVGAAPQR